MFNALAQVAQWHSTSDQGRATPPQASLMSRLTSLARRSQNEATSASSLNLHDAMDLDVDTRKTILCHRLRNVSTMSKSICKLLANDYARRLHKRNGTTRPPSSTTSKATTTGSTSSSHLNTITLYCNLAYIS